jgi:hypothetical protein
MAGASNHQNYWATEMGLDYIVFRKTTVIADVKLPRPKICNDVVFRGTKEEAYKHLEEIEKLPQNQSSDVIQVDLKVVKYDGQKSNTSARPGNGKR